MQQIQRHGVFRMAALALLGLLLWLPARAAWADTIVSAGDTVTEDVNVTEDFRLEAGGVVQASVHIWGGDAQIGGTIEGDLLVFGGDLTLDADARIDGDCVLLGGQLKRNDSALTCQTTEDLGLPAFVNRFGDFGSGFADGIDLEEGFDPGSLEGGAADRDGSLFGALGSSILLGLLALLVVSLAPRPVARISDAISARPLASGTVGVLTLFASISLAALLAVISAVLVIVCIGLLGFPIVLAIVALLGVGLLVGWVAVGRIVGNALSDALKLKTLSPALQAALGTAALSLGIGLLQLLPVVGFSASLVAFVVYGVGLGGVALTKFGTRPFPPVSLAPPRADKLDSVLQTLPDEAL